MKKYIVISLKNIIRRFFYWVYSYYERVLKDKISVYDLQAISVIHRMPKDAVCVDIGVNEGQLLDAMYKHCSSGKIYGFEPIPELYNYLSKKYSSSRVHLQQMVLSDTEEEVSFFYFPGKTGVSGMDKRATLLKEIPSQELHYKAQLLDTILAGINRIDLMKIDVEGAELKVLKGARETITRCKPVVIFECGYGGLEFFNGTPEEIFDFFDSLGYGICIQKVYLWNQIPLDRHSFLYGFNNGYEPQYIAMPKAR
jgi:FkbM family methyltransferase